MLRKKPAPPKTRRRFVNPWGELAYLCGKISYWLYTQGHKARAEHYLDRLKRVLRELPENDAAIVREEGLALLYELKGKLGEAIAHRRREIQLMEWLHREAGAPEYSDNARAYMLRDRDIPALQGRRSILESLEKAKTQRPTMRSAGRNERNSRSHE